MQGFGASCTLHVKSSQLDSLELTSCANILEVLVLRTNKGYHAQVYKAKMGSLDVAIKTINRQHVNPQLTSQQALQVMQQVTTLQGLGFRNCA